MKNFMSNSNGKLFFSVCLSLGSRLSLAILFGIYKQFRYVNIKQIGNNNKILIGFYDFRTHF